MGSRLNYELPKSLIDIDGRKMLDIIVEQLNLTGVVNITLITGYKDYLFSEYNINKIQNKKFRFQIRYIVFTVLNHLQLKKMFWLFMEMFCLNIL